MTSQSWVDTELVVRHSETGSVRIGQASAAPAGLEIVHLDGALLEIDPAAPELAPSAVVSDPMRAAPAIELLYGSAIADALRSDLAGSRSLPLADSSELRLLQRLGLVSWLARLSPLPLDPDLLDLEIQVLQLESGDLLEHDRDRAAESSENAAGFVAHAALARASPELTRQPTALNSLITRALTALEQTLPVDHDARRAVEAELDAVVDRAVEPRTVDGGIWTSLGWPALTRPTDRAGPSRESSQGGASTADWDRVPRGVLSPNEGAVLWRVARGGVLTVVADGAPAYVEHPALRGTYRDFGRGGRETAALRFALYRRGWPFPLAEGGLERRADLGAWLGVVRLSVDAEQAAFASSPDGLFVDVATPTTRRPPRTELMSLAGEAERWAVRGVSVLRLAVGTNDRARADLAKLAATALSHSQALWLELAARLPAAAPTATECAARCEALLDAVRAGRWEPPAGREDSGAGSVDSRRVAVFGDPGWALSAAESWYLRAAPRLGGA